VSWRVGQARVWSQFAWPVYDGDTMVAVTDTERIAAQVVEAVNATAADDAGRCPAVSSTRQGPRRCQMTAGHCDETHRCFSHTWREGTGRG
jgi:hypothetical protein